MFIHRDGLQLFANNIQHTILFIELFIKLHNVASNNNFKVLSLVKTDIIREECKVVKN